MDKYQLRTVRQPEPQQGRKMVAGSGNNTVRCKAMLHKEYQRTISLECARPHGTTVLMRVCETKASVPPQLQLSQTAAMMGRGPGRGCRPLLRTEGTLIFPLAAEMPWLAAWAARRLRVQNRSDPAAVAPQGGWGAGGRIACQSAESGFTQ